MEILVLTIFVIWVISALIVVNIYYNKNIGTGFWPLVGLLIPIINTIIVIKYGNISWTFDSLKEFIKELNKD